MRITITDIREAGHCVSGARTWFAGYNLDFRDFIKNGIDAADFLATGDAIAVQIVDRKIQREALDFGDLEAVTITIDDVRETKRCVTGTRAWFEQNGLDFQDFLSNGIPADKLMGLGDFDARMVVRHKLEKVRG